MTARSWKFESSSGHQFRQQTTTVSSLTKTRESGFLYFQVLIIKSKQGFTEQNDHRIVRPINGGDAADAAQMVKLVDTPASGAGDRKVVEVRVFFWAPIQTKPSHWLGLCFQGSESVMALRVYSATLGGALRKPQALNCPRLAFNCAASPFSTLPLAVVSTTAFAAFSACA